MIHELLFFFNTLYVVILEDTLKQCTRKSKVNCQVKIKKKNSFKTYKIHKKIMPLRPLFTRSSTHSPVS